MVGETMKVTQITRNSFQLTRLGLVNCYLIREDDGLTLVDTGVLSSSEEGILSAANSLGARIRRIVLTHAHQDHVGAVDAVMAKLGADRVELISNARSLPLLKQPTEMATLPGEPTGKIKGGLPGIASKPTRLLVEGDAVFSLRCINTPGHIPGHMAFLDERDGTLFAGDALVSVRELRVSSDAPWWFPLPKLVTWDAALALASAKKLLDYPIKRFACGHGRIIEGGLPVLRAAIEKAAG